MVEIGHPAHVHLFKNMIWKLERHGSKVKIVAVELSIDANDDIIAAVSAATTIPLSPDGIKLLISHGYALS